jgi:cytidylate kinase
MALHLERQGITPAIEVIAESALTSLDLRMQPEIAGMKLFLGEEEVSTLIREEQTGNLASLFSAKPEVRRALLGLQRSVGERLDLVAEGRDMGTVVFPDAQVKFFLTAELDQRSQRRYLELCQRGEKVSSDAVRDEMRARDHRDASRKESPLVPAPDAIIIDTTGLAPDEVLEAMLKHIASRVNFPTEEA